MQPASAAISMQQYATFPELKKVLILKYNWNTLSKEAQN